MTLTLTKEDVLDLLCFIPVLVIIYLLGRMGLGAQWLPQ